MYKYEMHAHSSQCSACAGSRSEDMVRKHIELGYSGMIFTDHFLNGCTCVPNELCWHDRISYYAESYNVAKEVGDKNDFDVLFGIEYNYGGGKEILTYCITPQFLFDNVDLDLMPVEEYAALVHRNGGLLVHAHPYRTAPYLPEGIAPRLDLVDGVEVYNACNKFEDNARALVDAQRLGLIETSGSDVHSVTHAGLGKSGMLFKRRIRDNADLKSALLHRRGKLICDGQCE